MVNQSCLQRVDDIVNIRNAIAHAWGKIDKCTNAVTLQRIILRRDWIQETNDGYVFLGDVAYAEAIQLVRDLVRYILERVPISGDQGHERPPQSLGRLPKQLGLAI